MSKPERWTYDPDTLGVNLPRRRKLRFCNPVAYGATREEEAQERERLAMIAAAAPEMLAALKLVFDRQYAEKTEDAVQLTAEVFDAIAAAIAKAEGRSK